MISTKPKKILTPEQLEKLKVAREKALAVRQDNAKDKALVKELAQAEKTQHITEVKAKLSKIKEVPKVVQVESEPEDEPEPEPVVKVKKVKKKKKIMIVEDSDSDDEQQQIIYVKKMKQVPKTELPVPVVVPETKPVSVPVPEPTQDDDPYQNHYNSLFNQRRRAF